MDVTFAELLQFGAASGVVAGVVNQGASALRDRGDRRFKTKQQEDDRQHQLVQQESDRAHQATLRRMTAHAEARDRFLQLAGEAYDWIQYEWGQRHGLDVDYVGANVLPPSLGKPEEVVRALRTIATQHPTRTVRRTAARLESSIDSCFNMVEQQRDGNYSLGEPSDEEFRRWFNLVEEIIESIHDPEPDALEATAVKPDVGSD